MFKTSKMKNFILAKILAVTNMLTIKIFSGMYNKSEGLLLKNGYGQPYFGFG